jgi:hypothetical protein
MPLMLTAPQLDHLYHLASPIEPARRPEYLAAVTQELEIAGGIVADGNLHRIAARLQRQFWEPPSSTVAGTPQHHRVRV